MGIRLVEGHRLSFDDTRDSARVAVVNQTFARRFTGGASPIGRTLRTHPEPDYPATDYTIVGVFADTKYDDIKRETPAMVYCPDSQFPTLAAWSTVMIRSDLPSAPLMRAVKARLRERQPAMVVESFDFAAAIRDGFVGQRLMAMLAGFFGAVAGLVAIVGIYGMVAYGVERRRRSWASVARSVLEARSSSGWSCGRPPRCSASGSPPVRRWAGWQPRRSSRCSSASSRPMPRSSAVAPRSWR